LKEETEWEWLFNVPSSQGESFQKTDRQASEGSRLHKKPGKGELILSLKN
jgi:hypothetical protein